MTEEQELQLKVASATARCFTALGERFNHMANAVTQRKTGEELEELQREWALSDKPEQWLQDKFRGKARAAKSGLLDNDEWNAENIGKLSDSDFDRNLKHRRQVRRGLNGRP